ncbi:nitrate reductase [Clostridium polyendosporum]|uniref:Nitrate reductase n=1 Tax=Clostridium polyendosporum TaxID=69208 RepID=A0A919RY49_9CLOT|nr:dimethylarginine dimethylaminohydrolase family protein [Clostridium polyendosporum]GIM27595.1 nitrate reductase [Clostridium polyendosporum]
MKKTYVKNATGILKKVLLCPPDNFKLQPINVIAQRWLSEGKMADKEACLREHAELVQAYEENGVEVVLIKPAEGLTNQVFARDFGACIAEGYILGNFKEAIRKAESEVYAKKLEELGIPCVAKCTEGYFEGGDFWFLDDCTLVLGNIARTDRKGSDCIKKQVNELGYGLMTVECDKEYLHLDMCFNIVAEKTAVICSEALPYYFIKILEKRGFTLIDVPRELVFKHACNLQGLGGEKVISIKNNKDVNERLKTLGLEVIAVDLVEILKNGGGPHCMTFPLERV